MGVEVSRRFGLAQVVGQWSIVKTADVPLPRDLSVLSVRARCDTLERAAREALATLRAIIDKSPELTTRRLVMLSLAHQERPKADIAELRWSELEAAGRLALRTKPAALVILPRQRECEAVELRRLYEWAFVRPPDDHLWARFAVRCAGAEVYLIHIHDDADAGRVCADLYAPRELITTL